MEDIGDLLFWVLAAVIGIVGAITNKRKKDAEQRQKTAESIPGQVDDTYFPDPEKNTEYTSDEEMQAGTQYEMIGDKDLQSLDSTLDEDIMQSSMDQAFKMSAEYEGNYLEPMADDFADEGIAMTDTTIENSELGTMTELSDSGNTSWAKKLIRDFDLPKAIVYSEIINRKDFV